MTNPALFGTILLAYLSSKIDPHTMTQNRPVIGIFSLPEDQYNSSSRNVIYGNYIKQVESAGARAIFFDYTWTEV